MKHQSLVTEFGLSHRQMLATSPSVAKLCSVRNADEEPWEMLASAVVCAAADDYREALKDWNTVALADLEIFFKSKWARLLSRGRSLEILYNLHEEYTDKHPRGVRPWEMLGVPVERCCT